METKINPMENFSTRFTSAECEDAWKVIANKIIARFICVV